MIVASRALLLAGAIGVTPPAPAHAKPLTIQDISRAAEARVAVLPAAVDTYGSCNPACTRPSDGWRIWIRRPVYRVLSHRTCQRPRTQALATFILAHEAGHAHRIISEREANVYAYAHFNQVARRLKFKPRRLVPALPPLGTLRSSWMEWGRGC